MVNDEQQQDDSLHPQSPSHPQVDANPVASTSTSSSQGLGLKDQTSASSNTFYSTDSGGINTNTELNRQQGVDMDRDRDRDVVADDDSLPNRTSSSSIESSFVPSRPRNQVSSILPPAAFFAPKRKQQSTSPTWGFASLPNNNSNNNPSSSTSPIPQHPLSLSRSGSDSRNHQQRSNSRSSNHHQSQSTSTSPAFNSINLPNESERGGGPTNSNWKPDSNRPNSPWGVASTINNRDSQDHDQDREDPTSSTTQIVNGNGNGGLDPKALQSYYKKGSLKSNKYSREPLLNVDRNQQGANGNGEKFNNLSSPSPNGGGNFSPSKNQTRFSTQSNNRQRGGIDRSSQSQEISTTSQRRSSTKLQSLPGHRLTKERNHTKFQGSNRFFLFGLIMTSSDNPLPFLGSLALVLILGGLFFGFVSPFVWREVSIAPVIVFAYTWLVATVNMM